MADLTSETVLTTAWKDITTALSLVDDSDYRIDVVSADTNAGAWSAETDDENPPSISVQGHPIFPANRTRGSESGFYSQEAGKRLWMKIDRGDAVIVASEAA